MIDDQDIQDDDQPVEPEAKVILTAAEYDALVKEAQDYKEKYLRLYAEFDNARKRMEREKIEFIKYANEGLILEFLDILDDLHRSVDAVKAQAGTDPNLAKGLELVVKRLDDVLARNGVKVIEAKGKPFDHDQHEVLMQEESDRHDDNVVMDEFQKGYKLHDKVVRTAKVKLAKKKSA
ncbi:MAG: nucleotide exchange factor GrpE [Candidatus Omnitrophica bacterium CG12_big_fil_rev_8_21_14_0_65_50_5]|nr:MAG: nucleotide exchange factor GrpE [Candidatus Omnitrophica bacterium CG12_big_fil_rev_8_21_14_0_65_50_5]